MMAQLVFWMFAGMAILFTLMVVFLKNPLSSALSLVASFFCVSAIYVFMHATFLSVIQILVYTGAIMVLFLYCLMLLNLQEDQGIMKTHLSRLVFAGLLLFNFIYFPVVYFDFNKIQNQSVNAEFGGMAVIGDMLVKDHVILFEWLSVLLLLGIMAVVMLTYKNKEQHD